MHTWTFFFFWNSSYRVCGDFILTLQYPISGQIPLSSTRKKIVCPKLTREGTSAPSFTNPPKYSTKHSGRCSIQSWSLKQFCLTREEKHFWQLVLLVVSQRILSECTYQLESASSCISGWTRWQVNLANFFFLEVFFKCCRVNSSWLES